MKNCCYAVLALLLLMTAPAFATVIVSSPSNGSTVGSSVPFVATATTDCREGVSAMGVYVDDQLMYVGDGATLKKSLKLASGSHQAYVEEWDGCNGSSGTAVNLNVTAKGGVFVSSPANNSTVNSTVNYVATATTSCPKGVSAMGVYVNNQLTAVSQGNKLNTQITLGSGPQNTVVQAWNGCGSSQVSPIEVTVQNAGNVLSNIQAHNGWKVWGELGPSFTVCSPCAGLSWDTNQHVSSPSLSGDATRFVLGGTKPYSDVLWYNPLIGDGSTYGLPDHAHKILPNVHNMIYDTYVYVTDLGATQSLEFDANMYMNGVGMEWGTQCDHLGSGDWDVWNNVKAHWIATGVACKLNNNTWNHVVFQVQREADNTLLYQTITVNGVTATINQTYAPFKVASGWYGMTVNFQIDGNHNQTGNTVYLDKFNLTYW